MHRYAANRNVFNDRAETATDNVKRNISKKSNILSTCVPPARRSATPHQYIHSDMPLNCALVLIQSPSTHIPSATSFSTMLSPHMFSFRPLALSRTR